MISDRFIKLFGRELAARNTRALAEAKTLTKREADLEKRSKDLKRRERQVETRRDDFQKSLEGLNAVDEVQQREIAKQQEAMIADAETLLADWQQHLADWEQLRADERRVVADLDAINEGYEQRSRRVAQANFVMLMLTAGLALLGAAITKDTWARGIHLDYYSAVAAIMPVLLVAGFVEVALLRATPGTWTIVNFAIPALGSTGGALYVLASHHSTLSTAFLTIWGMSATVASLVTYFGIHIHIDSARRGS